MSDVAGTTIDDLVAALKSRRAPLPFEIGAFVALSVCEELVSAPAHVSGSVVRIASDGAVSVSAPTTAASDEACARAIIALLAQLLVAAGPSVPPRLHALVDRGPSDGAWRVERVRDELAAALVPLNRGASRRVLARLVRESGREQRPSAVPVVVEGAARGALDDELDALLDAAPAGASPGVEAERAGAAFDTLPGGQAAVVDEAADEEPAAAPVAVVARSSAAAPVAVVPVSAPVTSDVAVEAPAARRPVVERASLEGFDEGAKKRSAAGPVVAVLALLVLAVGGAFVLRPDLFGGTRVGAVPAPSDAGVAVAPPAGRFGELRVRTTPEGAQVLLFVGRGPAVAADVPVGVGAEFVVLADGKAAARAVIAPDAEWDTTPGGKRYELAMMAGEQDVAFAALDLGAVRLPGVRAAAGGERGEVRIVTAPRGAKVYRLMGTTPDLRLAHLPSDEGLELLVYAEGYAPERVVVGPSDWRDDHGARVADITATLVARPPAAP